VPVGELGKVEAAVAVDVDVAEARRDRLRHDLLLHGGEARARHLELVAGAVHGQREQSAKERAHIVRHL
jgi:hypothetical protein